MQKTIVVIANPDVHLRSEGAAVTSVTADVSGLTSTLDDLGVELRPLFGEPEDRLIARMSALETPGARRPPSEALDLFYQIEVPDSEAEAVAGRIAALPEVAGAYVQPDPVPAATRRGASVTRAPKASIS